MSRGQGEIDGYSNRLITIYYYGIIIMLGALAAAGLAAYEAKRKGQSSDIVWDGLVWVLIGGILGARIWHILDPSGINGRCRVHNHVLSYPPSGCDQYPRQVDLASRVR